MLLYELFDSDARLKEIHDDGDIDYVGRLSDGTYIKIMFSLGRTGQYDCTFARGEREDFSDASFDKTGQGAGAEVMGVVSNAIQRFMVNYDPESVTFTANKKPTQPDNRKMSRTNLYAHMLSRIKSPDYVIKKVAYGGFDEYKIIKRDSTAHSEAEEFHKAFGSDLS